ncbi:hypothetical protein [Salinactinospora qingdaonensis]|uniref:Uncharacterized protein n=1 Tax=Salinactinospora qingdaonensis TaxID=702744 RepID=A0ABP7G5Z1_9ACTN
MTTTDETPRPSAAGHAPRRRRSPAAALAAAGAVAALAGGCGAAASPPAPAPAIPTPATTASLSAQDVNTWLDGLMPAALEDAGIAGAAVSVVHDGEPLTARGHAYSGTGPSGGGPQPVAPAEGTGIFVPLNSGGHERTTGRQPQGTVLSGGVDRVEALGVASALPPLLSDPGPAAMLSLPVVLASVVVLVGAMLSWPIGALVRWWLSRPQRDRAGWWPRLLTRIGVSASVVALLGWWAALYLTMFSGEAPSAVVWLLKFLQLAGLFAILPATLVLVDDIHRGAGGARRIGSGLVLLALLGSGWYAMALGPLSPYAPY